MRRYSNLIIIIVSVLLTILFFGFFIVSVPLVPVTNYFSTIYEYSVDDKHPVVMIKKYSIKTLNGDQVFICKDFDELKQILEKDKRIVGFIPWFMVTPQLKTVRYNGKYFWDDNQNDFLSVKKFVLLPGVKYSKNNITNVTVGGTVVLSRGIGNVIERTNDVFHPWSGIAQLFKNADCAIVNFKSPLVYNYVKPDSTWKLYGKAKYAAGLGKSGIDIVSIAGNHIGDAGVQGIFDTQRILTSMKIQYTGAATENGNAYTPVIYKMPQLTVGFISINGVGSSKYSDARGNVVYIAGLSENNIKQRIAELRPSVDVIIVMPNWGDEYVSAPNQTQVKWGNFLIDNGADIVVGDQAHWVQKVSFYKDRFISYGLGNLIFDQSWSNETKEGVIERFIFYKKRLIAVDLIPVTLNDRWYTEPATDNKIRGQILERMLTE